MLWEMCHNVKEELKELVHKVRSKLERWGGKLGRKMGTGTTGDG
jgi:hypothetical protein